MYNYLHKYLKYKKKYLMLTGGTDPFKVNIGIASTGTVEENIAEGTGPFKVNIVIVSTGTVEKNIAEGITLNELMASLLEGYQGFVQYINGLIDTTHINLILDDIIIYNNGDDQELNQFFIRQYIRRKFTEDEAIREINIGVVKIPYPSNRFITVYIVETMSSNNLIIYGLYNGTYYKIHMTVQNDGIGPGTFMNIREISEDEFKSVPSETTTLYKPKNICDGMIDIDLNENYNVLGTDYYCEIFRFHRHTRNQPRRLYPPTYKPTYELIYEKVVDISLDQCNEHLSKILEVKSPSSQ